MQLKPQRMRDRFIAPSHYPIRYSFLFHCPLLNPRDAPIIGSSPKGLLSLLGSFNCTSVTQTNPRGAIRRIELLETRKRYLPCGRADINLTAINKQVILGSCFTRCGKCVL